MQIPDHHPLARTLALLDPDTAPAAAAGMRGTAAAAEIEGLVELLLNPEATATAAAAALRSLEHDSRPVVTDAVIRVFGSPHPTVRILATTEVVRRHLFDPARDRLVAILRADPFWQVRRAAVTSIGADPGDGRWAVCHAATDPHWRVRHALAQLLENWADRPRIDTELEQLGHGPRVRRVRDYLAYRWAGQFPPTRPADDPSAGCPFWDWDPAVLARTLDRLGRAGRRAALDVLPRLVHHPDERVRGWVVQALRDDGESRHWADALGRLGDPREDTAPPVDQLVRGVELDRLEAVAKFVLRMGAPPPAALAWALEQVGEAFPAEEVSEDLQRLGAVPPRRVGTAERANSLPGRAPFTPDHSHARAASLTPERARELVENPTLETSWFVLARAARMCKTPLWNLEPANPWKPPAGAKPPDAPVTIPVVTTIRPRQLGPGGPVVSPLGVSGHYGLPVEGFARAAEQGVNLFFWEPNYATLTRFMTRLAPSERRQLSLLAGTFEADGAKVRKDAERALRNLKLDQLGVFLVFWVQSWARITDDVRDALERLKAEGKVQAFGLSTHNRSLAVEAVRDGWNPVMVRHSAAHRKAEAEVFPVARAHGTSVITFNNTCYGRLLDPGENGERGFRPADCFRFTLATPGVSACFTAPATPEQLDENLNALRNPELADDVRDRLIRRGEWLYREDTVFRRTIRADV
ncbi:MAG: repeat protein [Gemmataceae bacterium]|nr:repeat protein [Gemmataceae bacterium]